MNGIDKIERRTDKAATEDWSALADRGDRYVGQLFADNAYLIKLSRELLDHSVRVSDHLMAMNMVTREEEWIAADLAAIRQRIGDVK